MHPVAGEPAVVTEAGGEGEAVVVGDGDPAGVGLAVALGLTKRREGADALINGVGGKAAESDPRSKQTRAGRCGLNRSGESATASPASWVIGEQKAELPSETRSQSIALATAG